MRFLLLVLGLAGCGAILGRVARTLLLLARGGVEAFLAGDLATTRAQRGDITGVQDADAVRARALRLRRLAVARLGFWLGLLLLPFLTGWPAAVYAGYSLLWLVPARRSHAA